MHLLTFLKNIITTAFFVFLLSPQMASADPQIPDFPIFGNFPNLRCYPGREDYGRSEKILFTLKRTESDAGRPKWTPSGQLNGKVISTLVTANIGSGWMTFGFSEIGEERDISEILNVGVGNVLGDSEGGPHCSAFSWAIRNLPNTSITPESLYCCLER